MIPISEITVKIRNINAMGRVKKIFKEPSDMINDCRRAVSPMGPKMNAMRSGAVANWNLVIRKSNNTKSHHDADIKQ